MKITVFWAALIAVALGSCKNEGLGTILEADNTLSSENLKEFKTTDIVSVLKAPTEISIEDLAKLVGVDSQSIEVNEDYEAFRPSERRLLYSWANGQTDKMTDLSGETFEIPSYSSIGLTGLKKMAVADFKERFESADYLQKQIDSMTENEQMDSDRVMAEAENLAEIQKTQKFEKIEGVGELAYWESPINALHVYTDGTAFTVSTNLSEAGKSKQTAVAFLNLILEN